MASGRSCKTWRAIPTTSCAAGWTSVSSSWPSIWRRRPSIAGWDGEETSDRLELLLGPDLQYIRINGTVVGGAVGLALHGIGQAVG